jgi:hypothetical protein
MLSGVLLASMISGCGGNAEDAARACNQACRDAVNSWIHKGKPGAPPVAYGGFCKAYPKNPICP